ncbi:DUF559 domain-containing protein [Nesterenkonia flava]
MPAKGQTAAEILSAGLALRDLRHAVANRTATRVAWGMYCGTAPTSEPIEDKQPEVSGSQAILQVLTAKGNRAVSHQSAAAIWGFWDRPLEPPYHVTSPPGRAPVQRPGLVVAHRGAIPAEFLQQVGGVVVVSAAWAWCDLALQTSVEEAVVLADQVLSRRIRRPGRRSPLAHREDLEAAVSARGRANGIRTARAALALASDAVDSRPESRLRYRLHEAGLPEPEVNVLISDPSGRLLIRPDLVFRQWKVAVQYEGVDVHSAPERVLQDVRRQEVTEQLGWTEVRITRDHMRNRGRAAVLKVLAALRARGYSG